jgi:hypothetical protein
MGLNGHQRHQSEYGLPDRHEVTLTELVTWYLHRQSKSDIEVEQERRAAVKRVLNEIIVTRKQLHGAGWLLPPLEMIRDGISWPLSGDDGLDTSNATRLQKAKQWISSKDFSVESAIKLVQAEIQKNADQTAHELRKSADAMGLHNVLFAEAANERMKVWGVRYAAGAPMPLYPAYQQVPCAFFYGQSRHYMGHGPHGPGSESDR